jgi:hypothetical protein
MKNEKAEACPPKFNLAKAATKLKDRVRLKDLQYSNPCTHLRLLNGVCALKDFS